MEEGSNVDGDESRGTSPVPAGCRHRSSGPPKLGGDGGGDRNCFWRKGFWNQGFRVASKNKGQGGPPGEVPVAQAGSRRGLPLGCAGWPPGPPLAPLWPHFGSSRSFLYADFSYIFPGIFLALLIRGKPEIEKTAENRNWHWGALS